MLTLRSSDPSDLPQVERGFLSDPADLAPILEGLELARELAADGARSPSSSPRSDVPGTVPPEEYVRSAVRGYFHPAGTCAIGQVVDPDCRVLGIEGLLVADASVMPTIPRANTNLTTAAIAERIAETI